MYFAEMDVLSILTEITSALPEEKNKALKQQLADYLNHLLLHNFPALVQLLYQVDVPEKKLRNVIQENQQEDAGHLIAELLLERQREKTVARNRFRFGENESEEERW